MASTHSVTVRRKRGFTLVELLVVITIIGMLMALLLPAVNAAVEAARNIQCKNNLGQLAKAVNSYQSEKNKYPGFENSVGTTTVYTVSWVVEIFPYIDRSDIYQKYSTSTGTPTPYIDMLVCPSDPPEQIGGAKLSYVANAGFGGAETAAKIQNNGIFLDLGKNNNIDNIKDGPSYTLLFSENIQAQRAAGWGGTSGGHRNLTTFMWHAATSTDHKINGNKTATTISADLARPSSFHSGGVNVAFADTHVIFLKEDVAYGVYRQLMTPNHAESDASGYGDAILDEATFK